MNIFTILKTELQPIGLPVYRDFYAGEETAYITVTVIDERPTVCGDGDDDLDTVTVDVDLFIRSDPTEKKRKIRRAIRSAGFAIQSVNNFYENDTKFYHTVFRCEIENYEVKETNGND